MHLRKFLLVHEDDIHLFREEEEHQEEREKSLERKRKERQIALEEKRIGPYRAFFEHKGIPMPDLVNSCQSYVFKHDLTEEFNKFKEECGE